MQSSARRLQTFASRSLRGSSSRPFSSLPPTTNPTPPTPSEYSQSNSTGPDFVYLRRKKEVDRVQLGRENIDDVVKEHIKQATLVKDG